MVNALSAYGGDWARLAVMMVIAVVKYVGCGRFDGGGCGRDGW